jgi:Leucine-rich repeat (LRR) protein
MPALKSVGIGSEVISDDGLRSLGNLKQLTALVITSNALSDGAVADVIAAQPNLRSLNLSVPLGSRTLRAVSALTELRELSIRHVSLTNARLAELGHLPNLRRVWLIGTSITPAGVAHLHGRNLEWLILDDRLKTAETFPHYLKALGDSPDDLRLDEWQIGDGDLVHLANCPGLTEIHVRDSNITPAGLKHLHSLMRLKRVWLDGQRRWKSAAAALKKALPECDVYE